MISLTNSQIGELMGQFLLAGTGTLSFAILFACPRRSLPTCALVGAVGWFVYELCVMLGLDTAAASLLAVIPLTILTRVFAILQKTPVTVFLLSGIFPLVPGAGIYYTAYYFIQGDNALALSNGISTFKVAVALAVGISLVLSIPLPPWPVWRPAATCCCAGGTACPAASRRSPPRPSSHWCASCCVRRCIPRPAMPSSVR